MGEIRLEEKETYNKTIRQDMKVKIGVLISWGIQVDKYHCPASSSLSKQHMHYMKDLENVAKALQILHLSQLVNNA